jgi:hypothetical protein
MNPVKRTAIPSELRVSRAVRVSGFCRRYSRAPKLSPGLAGLRRLGSISQVPLRGLLLGECGNANLQNQNADHHKSCPALEQFHGFGLCYLDSECRSTSAALFVQGISMEIPQQDMGSVVYQGSHAGFIGQTASNSRAPRAIHRCGGPR